MAVYSPLVLRGVCASSPSVGLSGRGVCGKLSRPGEAGGGGVIKWVLRWERGVNTDLEVRVRFSSVVMEVAGLWGQSRAGYRPEREARRDECGPVVQ